MYSKNSARETETTDDISKMETADETSNKEKNSENVSDKSISEIVTNNDISKIDDIQTERINGNAKSSVSISKMEAAINEILGRIISFYLNNTHDGMQIQALLNLYAKKFDFYLHYVTREQLSVFLQKQSEYIDKLRKTTIKIDNVINKLNKISKDISTIDTTKIQTWLPKLPERLKKFWYSHYKNPFSAIWNDLIMPWFIPYTKTHDYKKREAQREIDRIERNVNINFDRMEAKWFTKRFPNGIQERDIITDSISTIYLLEKNLKQTISFNVFDPALYSDKSNPSQETSKLTDTPLSQQTPQLPKSQSTAATSQKNTSLPETSKSAENTSPQKTPLSQETYSICIGKKKNGSYTIGGFVRNAMFDEERSLKKEYDKNGKLVQSDEEPMNLEQARISEIIDDINDEFKENNLDMETLYNQLQTGCYKQQRCSSENNKAFLLRDGINMSEKIGGEKIKIKKIFKSPGFGYYPVNLETTEEKIKNIK